MVRSPSSFLPNTVYESGSTPVELNPLKRLNCLPHRRQSVFIERILQALFDEGAL